MSSTKKKLEELNVIDDFLMNRLASDACIGEEFCRLLLSTLLQRKIGKVAVTVQKVIPPFSPERKGIRMDVRVEETKHNRFYQALHDTGCMRSGQKDYEALPDLYVLMILDEDPFGYDYMIYSIRNKCEEVQELEYEDGLRFYYFYTKGKQGGNEEIKAMLRYIGDSRRENVTDTVTEKLHAFTENIKIRPEVRESYMLWEEYEEMMREEGRIEGKAEESRETIFDFLREKGHISEDTAARINAEKDRKTLRKWVRLAAVTDSIADFEAGI